MSFETRYSGADQNGFILSFKMSLITNKTLRELITSARGGGGAYIRGDV